MIFRELLKLFVEEFGFQVDELTFDATMMRVVFPPVDQKHFFTKKIHQILYIY